MPPSEYSDYEEVIFEYLKRRRVTTAINYLVGEFKQKYGMSPNIGLINIRLCDVFLFEQKQGFTCLLARDRIAWTYCTAVYENLCPDRGYITIGIDGDGDKACHL